MNVGKLKQGQKLSEVGTPDYCGERSSPLIAGKYGCKSITVTQLAGPMGFYDCAHVIFEEGWTSVDEILIPLHQCDYIAI